MQLPVEYLSLSLHFLRLAEGAADMLVRRRNQHAVVAGGPITPAAYLRKTRWSDHSVGVAVLFNFYHGVELVLKGFLASAGVPPPHHKVTRLFADFKLAAPQSKLVQTLEPFVDRIDSSSPLGQFLAVNEIQIDGWYQAMKYPRSTAGAKYSHIKLQYGSVNTLAFWRSVRNGAKAARTQAVAQYNTSARAQSAA